MRPIRVLALSSLGAAMLVVACSVGADVAPRKAPPPAPPEQAWLEDIRVLADDRLQGRGIGTLGGEGARDYLVGRMEALGVAPGPAGRLTSWTRDVPARGNRPARTLNGVNVVGLIPGTRGPDRYIVVTAHYDHLGEVGGQIHNGADDNASGVATMLALAADLKRRPPEHSVLIVALDGEESGLSGARAFVAAPPVPLTSMAMNLNFDMTARAETDGKLWVTGTYQNPQFRPLLEPIAPNGAVSLAFGKDTPQDTGTNNWVMASDHGVFHEAGVPFLYLGVEFHADYHKPTDDFDRITPSVFISATELSIAAFRALDQGIGR